MTLVEVKLTKKQRRMAARQSQPAEQKGLYIEHIKPLTENQHKTFKAFYDDQNLLLHGSAGTGKSFISLYLALSEVLEGTDDLNRVVVLRSVVSLS